MWKKDLQKNYIRIPAFLWKNVRYKIEEEKIFSEIKIQDFVNEQANPVYIHTEIFACWEESQTLEFLKKEQVNG